METLFLNADQSALEEFKKNALAPKSENLKTRHELTKRISYYLKKYCHASFYDKIWVERIAVIGSTANGLGTITSDLDLNVTLNRALAHDELIKFLFGFQRYVRKKTKLEIYGHTVVIDNARVPIFRFPVTVDDGEIMCDICVNNIEAEWNTSFLHQIAQIDERIPQLVFMVKRFVKNIGLFGAYYHDRPYNATLSSYGWTLTVLYCLREIRPSIIPFGLWTAAQNGKPIVGHPFKSRNSINAVELFQVWLSYEFNQFQTLRQPTYRTNYIECPIGGHNVAVTITPSGRRSMIHKLRYYAKQFIPFLSKKPEIFFKLEPEPLQLSEISKSSQLLRDLFILVVQNKAPSLP